MTQPWWSPHSGGSGGFGHNLNNLLAPLRLYADLLEGSGLSASEQQRAGKAIRHAVDRLQRLGEMLGELGTTRTPHSDVAVTNLLEAIASELSQRDQVRVSVSVAPDCDRVRGDATQLGNALRLVCDNSVQALARSGGEITLRARSYPERERTVIDIIDDGSGIEPSLLPRVCEPFVTTKPPSIGFGLGLAVATAIISCHGGALDVRSEPGSGTTVTIELPTVC